MNRYFHLILNKLVSPQFYTRYVKLPLNNATPPEILNEPKFFPFFKDCLGAIDGSHLDAFVPQIFAASHRDRKGRLSKNLLAGTTFSMIFCYLLPGWEGSATDSRIYQEARKSVFTIPPGKFYLADAGFPLCDALLVPYRQTRYHLKEWGRATEKYISISVHATRKVLNTYFILGPVIIRNYSTFVILKHETLSNTFLAWLSAVFPS